MIHRNVQKQVYYKNRFKVEPSVPTFDVSEDEIFLHDVTVLQEKFALLSTYIMKDQLVIYVNPEECKEVIRCMKEVLSYNQLSELSAIDFLPTKQGFEVFYQLLSMSKRKRARVKIFIPEDYVVESVSDLYKSANWSEREMFDMFGIKINNHPNLRRVLMPDDWEGYPLRKSYPLQGDETAQWWEIDKIYGPEYRELFGAEQRDAARVDRYDTKNFARLGKEVPFGEETQEENTPIHYQEDSGVLLIDKFSTQRQKTLHERN